MLGSSNSSSLGWRLWNEVEVGWGRIEGLLEEAGCDTADALFDYKKEYTVEKCKYARTKTKTLPW
jgi:hypothetical protein